MPLLLCPNCQSNMQALQRAGVEFDMCPTCRGVWLDRGELEKIIHGARSPDPHSAGSPALDPHRNRHDRYDDQDEFDGRNEYRRDDRSAPRRRKRGFDLFDIFD